MDKELEKFKTEVNLEEFLIHFHNYNKDKGYSRNSPKLVKYNERGEAVSKLILKKNSKGHWTYWDVYNPDEIKGKTIIDFIQQNQRTKSGEFMTIGHVRKFLRTMLRSRNKKILLKKTVITPGSNENILTHLTKEKKLYPIKDYRFLEKRGIRKETYLHPAFNKLLYNIENDKHINTGYLLINKKRGDQALSVRNEKFKGVFGKKVDKIGATYFKPEKIKDINSLIITESFLDAMAHHQALKTDLSKTRYISTEGALTKEQMELIKESCQRHEVKDIRLSFDNDITGEQYSAKLISYLLNTDEILFEPKYNSQTKKAELDIILTTGSIEKNIHTLQEVKKEFEQLNDKLVYRVLEEKPFTIKTPEISDKKAIIIIEFKNIKPLWEELNERLIEKTKTLNISVIRETPKTIKEEYAHIKDWNDFILEPTIQKSQENKIKI